MTADKCNVAAHQYAQLKEVCSALCPLVLNHQDVVSTYGTQLPIMKRKLPSYNKFHDLPSIQTVSAPLGKV